MKLKKTILNQSIIKKVLGFNSNFIIFCISELFVGLDYRYIKLCKNNFKYPNFLFNFEYSSRVQNFILVTPKLLLITFLKLNYNKLKYYGLTYLYYNFFCCKELKVISFYFFDPKNIVYFFKNLLTKRVTLSSSNGKDIALSR